MKNRAVSALVLLMTLSAGTVLAIAADAKPTTKPTAVNKMCLVMPDDEVDPKVTVDYQGKTYGFCCKDCVAAFKKDPQKYVDKFEKKAE